MTKVGVGFRKVYAHVDIEAFAKKIEEIWEVDDGYGNYVVKDIIEGEVYAIEINYDPENFHILKAEFKEIGVEVEQLAPVYLAI